MKVFITGAAGFIGGFLARHCAESGSTVVGIDIREPETRWTAAAFERCDIRYVSRGCSQRFGRTGSIWRRRATPPCR